LGIVRRGLSWLLRPLHRFLVARTAVSDPWEPASSFLIRPDRFGTGSRRPFPWYFEGDSTVPVRDVTEICRWLSACEYVRDSDLFHEPDYWQHPLTFEQLRKGDCEDHALWAWRKLIELGITAEFYVGQWLTDRGGRGFHAWVVFEKDSTLFLLEPVIKDAGMLVKPLSAVRSQDVPDFSVDRTFKMCARSGLLVHWREEELARRGRRRGQAA